MRNQVAFDVAINEAHVPSRTLPSEAFPGGHYLDAGGHSSAPVPAVVHNNHVKFVDSKRHRFKSQQLWNRHFTSDLLPIFAARPPPPPCSCGVASAACSLCLNETALSLLAIVQNPCVAHETSFCDLDAIYLIISESRWKARRSALERDLRNALVGPFVYVVNASAVGNLHSEQASQHSHLAERLLASWTAAAVARDAVAAECKTVLLLHDDASFTPVFVPAAAAVFHDSSIS